MDLAEKMDQAKACQGHVGTSATAYFGRAVFHAEYCDACLDALIDVTEGRASAELRGTWRKQDGCKLHLVLVRDPVQSRALFLARNYPCCLRELAQSVPKI